MHSSAIKQRVWQGLSICKTCGTAYDTTPETCPICEDERQYVPHSGQAWIDFATVTSTHSNKWQQLEPQLFSIKTVPAFAINQRALLLRTPHGNIHAWPLCGTYWRSSSQIGHVSGVASYAVPQVLQSVIICIPQP